MKKATTKKDLKNYLELVAIRTCELMSEEVYTAINFYLNRWYSEYTPKSYSRTEDFLRSAFKTEIMKRGDTYEVVVGIDYSSMDNYKAISGYDVVSLADEGYHGDKSIQTETHPYSDMIDELILSGQLINDVADFLRSRGLKIV